MAPRSKREFAALRGTRARREAWLRNGGSNARTALGRNLQSSIRAPLVFRYDDGRRRPSWRASRRLDQCGGLLHDRLGRGVSLCQKRVDLGRCERLDLQLRLVRIGAKFTIGYRGVEGAPQRG